MALLDLPADPPAHLPADLPLSAEASARLSADLLLRPSLSPSLSPSLDPSVRLPLGTTVWHVAVTRPGMFPMYEARCPCEKSACGLVIPRMDIECDVHHGYATLRQAHSAADCSALRNGSRGPRRAGRRVAVRAGDHARPGLGGLLGGLRRR